MKTLIILHGWQSSKEKWEKVKNEIEKAEIEVILPDLPGFKRETALSKIWDLDDYVEWFSNFSANKENFFLLGHSFGGRIAVRFAAKYPQKLRGLILVSGAGIRGINEFWISLSYFISGGVGQIFQLPILQKFYPVLRNLFYRYILRKTDYLLAEGYLKETLKNIVKEDLTDYLEQIQIPTLLIWGEKDKTTPPKCGYLMKEKIKNSELKILEGVGHAPHLENPEKLSEIILKFLEKY